MLFLRLIGFMLVMLGILFTITIIGAAIGIPMMIFGLLFIVVGRKPRPIVVHMHSQPSSQDGGHSR